MAKAAQTPPSAAFWTQALERGNAIGRRKKRHRRVVCSQAPRNRKRAVRPADGQDPSTRAATFLLEELAATFRRCSPPSPRAPSPTATRTRRTGRFRSRRTRRFNDLTQTRADWQRGICHRARRVSARLPRPPRPCHARGLSCTACSWASKMDDETGAGPGPPSRGGPHRPFFSPWAGVDLRHRTVTIGWSILRTKDKTMQRSCGNCRYYHPLIIRDYVGTCRLRPPRLVKGALDCDVSIEQRDALNLQRWPGVFCHNSCRSFEWQYQGRPRLPGAGARAHVRRPGRRRDLLLPAQRRAPQRRLSAPTRAAAPPDRLPTPAQPWHFSTRKVSLGKSSPMTSLG